MTTAYPGVVKGWHYHKKQADNMAVVKGMMKIVLYDGRKDSATFGEINEIFAGCHNLLWCIFQLLFTMVSNVFPRRSYSNQYTDWIYNYNEPDEYRLLRMAVKYSMIGGEKTDKHVKSDVFDNDYIL